ncbi:thioredoxin family protein [Paenibacillus cremeus]|uniref:Thioredoxin family protein n=1 Tax=Paenibacillus cremeus TaxID=2163881 RepID=A0A559K808_9BACL|nr:thioredoxin family protein [Paenibacillus cremeus]TVY08276.1 thioredoxin family protein [Paenibacillus cremeus]
MKKLSIYLGLVIVLFGALYYVNHQSSQAKYGKYANNVYGIAPDKLNPETLKQLDDPNYQNIILPDALDKKIAAKEDFFLYYFASTCVHCKATTPVLMPIAKSLNTDIKQFNLEEFKNGWQQYNIQFTPTLIYYKGGKEAERLEGEQTADAFKAFLTKYKK